MANSQNSVNIEVSQKCPGCLQAIITVPQQISIKLYQEAVQTQKKRLETFGFSKGGTPEHYIEQNYKAHIHDHLKSFLFHYFALNSLYHSIMKKKIILANEPELESMVITPENHTIFTFLIDTHEQTEPLDWKNIAFKPPSRKNYKDIDRQVENFIEQETKTENANPEEVNIGDLVCFEIQLLDQNGKTIFGEEKETLWLKIGSEQVDKDMYEIFKEKKVGDRFISHARGLQEYFSDKIDTPYQFAFKILAVASHTYFDFERFKKHFQLKTTKDLHKKLIEAFSFRNDLSQRRETVEKTLKQLIQFYKLKPREYLIDQQQERVLKAVQQNPDYYVYKSEKNFKKILRDLAEKQLKETIIIDLIAYHENITVDIEDIANYLTLTQRPRTKMFLYFNLPPTKVNGQEMPLSNGMLTLICQREKTLNHIINTLTRRK